MATEEPEALGILRYHVRTSPETPGGAEMWPPLLLRHEREIVDHVDKITAERDALPQQQRHYDRDMTTVVVLRAALEDTP